MQLAVTAFALTVVCAIAGAAADEAEQQQIAVDLVKQRTLATESVTAVCGNMSVIKYDHTFEVQSTGTGEFGFLDRGHGFWRVDAAPAIPIERRCNGRSGKPYAHREMVPYHVRWYADEVYDIDEGGF